MTLSEAKALKPGDVVTVGIKGSRHVVRRVEISARTALVNLEADGYCEGVSHRNLRVPDEHDLARWAREEKRAEEIEAMNARLLRVKSLLGGAPIDVAPGFHSPPSYRVHLSLEQAEAICDRLEDKR